MLKPPVWTWEVPAYFFVGGAAGAASVIAAVAGLSGVDPAAATDARWIAAAGAAVSPMLLISDLGRPARFLNMLRVFKLQSPMSVGAWTLAAFSTAVFASIALTGIAGPEPAPFLRVACTVADVVAALTGLVLATYTGVLIGATALPVWSRHVRWLPILFGASALGSAVSLVELAGHRTDALNRAGIGAAAMETLAGVCIAMALGDTRPAWSSRSGQLARLGGLLTGPLPLLLRVGFGHTDRLRILVALGTIGGALLTRFGWIALGRSVGSR